MALSDIKPCTQCGSRACRLKSPRFCRHTSRKRLKKGKGKDGED